MERMYVINYFLNLETFRATVNRLYEFDYFWGNTKHLEAEAVAESGDEKYILIQDNMHDKKRLYFTSRPYDRKVIHLEDLYNSEIIEFLKST